MTNFIDMEVLEAYIGLFSTVFCSGFMLTVLLHYAAYGIFKALSLINIIGK